MDNGPTTTHSEHRFRWFDESACDRCGECFVRCPVVELDERQAREEIEALIRGDTEASKVFDLCTTCNLCDFVCPTDAKPYELILERFGAYQEEHGLPSLAKLVFPSEPENIWSGLRGLMDEDERTLVDSWEANLRSTENRQVLLMGFYANLVPYLATASVLDDLRPVMAGSEALWGCGGDTNKLGLTRLTEQIIQRVRGELARGGVERVVCFMQAEAAMLAEVLPSRYGADFAFEIVSLDRWLLRRIETGAMPIVRELSLRATVHDNCLSRYQGGESHETVRRIVATTGCELVEMEHNRSEALCCGWGATVPTMYGERSGNPFGSLSYLLYSLQRRLQEAEATGANVLVASCPACYTFLSLIAELTGARIQVRHPIELLEMAAGRPWTPRNRARAWQVLAVATNLIVKWLSSRRERQRFFPRPLQTSMPRALPECPPRDARRIGRLARFFAGPLVQNRVCRKLIAIATRAFAAWFARRRGLPRL